jgi:hypothetical protein
MPAVPQPKWPHITAPTIRGVAAIPHVGSAGASATTFIGAQFGNLPDLGALLAAKALKKALLEQIYALFKGQLPDATRPPVYLARQLQLTDEVAEVSATINNLVAGVTAEAEAAIDAINEKAAEMNAAKTAIEAIPVGARNAVQRLMLTRYERYASELDAQAGRLNAAIASFAA